MQSKWINVVIIIGVILMSSYVGYSQPCTDCPPPDDPPNPIPITGIEILIGAGGLWGAKKVMDWRKGRKA